MSETGQWIDQIAWNSDGLLPAISQDHVSGRVLMMAWMNRESLQLSVEGGYAVYWSRSRGQLWRKGETSGNRQKIEAIRLDCDGDTLLISVQQEGGIACHTGRESCFYRRLDGDNVWQSTDEVLRSPEELYGSK